MVQGFNWLRVHGVIWLNWLRIQLVQGLNGIKGSHGSIGLIGSCFYLGQGFNWFKYIPSLRVQLVQSFTYKFKVSIRVGDQLIQGFNWLKGSIS